MKKVLCMIIAMIMIAGLVAVEVILKDSKGRPYKFEKTREKGDNGDVMYMWLYSGNKLDEAITNVEDIFNVMSPVEIDNEDENRLAFMCAHRKTGKAIVLVVYRVPSGQIFMGAASTHDFKVFR